MTFTSERVQKKYYDSISTAYSKHYSHPQAIAYRRDVILPFLKRNGITLEGKMFLDALCGGGQHTLALCQGKEVHVGAFDLSFGQCREYCDGQVLCASAAYLPFADASFDVAITDSLHHLHPNVRLGINELIRVVRPNGVIILWEPCSGSFLDLLRRKWYRTDPKFFTATERSIDFAKLHKDFRDSLECLDVNFGGNIAHLLVSCNLAFRAPAWLVSLYGPCLRLLEQMLNPLQSRMTACWFLAVLKKR